MIGGVGQAHPVGNGLHHGQKQGQHHGLNGEHEQVLENVGHGEHIELAAHHELVVEHHQRGLQQNVHEQADAEPAQHHPGGGELHPVQKQGENQAARDFRQHEGQEIGIPGQQHAQHIRSHGGHDAHHRAEDHGAHGVGDEGGVDLQVGSQGDVHQLQRHPKGDHQGREHQHFGVLQLQGGIPPVGLGKGGFVEVS